MTTAAHLVGSMDGAIETAIEPCGRLGLFLGAGALGLAASAFAPAPPHCRSLGGS